jgi:hypothetical protein
MKLTTTAVFALSLMVASAFGAAKQETTTQTTPHAKVSTSKVTTSKVTAPKVKKHKKIVKSTTSAMKPAAAVPVAAK